MEYISDSYYILTFLIIASFCAGFIDSIAGGGGFILVPALMLAGLTPTMAVATNKLPAVFAFSAVHFQLQSENFDSCFDSCCQLFFQKAFAGKSLSLRP